LSRAKTARPVRGTPEETRARLVAAAEVFNKSGFEGTDSNKIAKAAGYAPGTFYKHFEDKRAIFLAVYREWVSREWQDVRATLAEEGSTKQRASRLVASLIAYHAKWRGFRSSLRAIVGTDATVRAFYRSERRRQLEMLAELGGKTHARASREEDAMLLFVTERAADALADGEAAALGLDKAVLEALLVALVSARIP
jgi:AcrR family transcriptional regulator